MEISVKVGLLTIVGHKCKGRPINDSWKSEVESSRTSLASRTSSRTHFEVLGLGLGLEASSPWPWPWPRSLRSSKIALSSARGQHYF